MDTKKILELGQDFLDKEHTEGQQDRLGLLRAGSFGILTPSGSIGNCLRVAHLRKHNLSTPVDFSTHQMFAAGHANEDIVTKQLKAGLSDDYEILRETEIPVHWTDGFTLSGSPDIVIRDKATGQLEKVLELKEVSAVNTAIGVHYDLKPKSNHLIQAGLYSWRLSEQYNKGADLPCDLVYASRVIWVLPAYPADMVERVQRLAYNLEFRKGRKSVNIRPFVRVYQITWGADGFLSYMTDGLPRPVKTIISKEALKLFGQEADKKKIHERPTSLDVLGKRAYNPCNYCQFEKVCDKYETSDYQTWLNAIEKDIQNG